MKSADIVNKINSLKNNQKTLITNSHIVFAQYPDKEWDTIEGEESLVIAIREKEIRRLFFYSTNIDELKKLIQPLILDSVIEVVSKEKDLIKNIIEELGFHRIVTQIRVSSKDISTVFNEKSIVLENYDESVGNVAQSEDADQINSILWDTFDTRSSHLMSKEELLEHIQNGEIHICKDENKEVKTIIQCVMSSKSLYFNQVINQGDKKKFHALTLNILKEYIDQGGKYAYAWVNDGNIASFKFFEKYSLIKDGLYNSIYCTNKEKIERIGNQV